MFPAQFYFCLRTSSKALGYQGQRVGPPLSILTFSIVNTPLRGSSCSRCRHKLGVIYCSIWCSRLSPILSLYSSLRNILDDHTDAKLLFEQVFFEGVVKSIDRRLLKLLLAIHFGELIYLLVGVLQKLSDDALIVIINLLQISTLDLCKIVLPVLHSILNLL